MANEAFIRLDDGRTLSYGEYGDPHAEPVFYFHGWPGSRHEGQLIAHPGLRVIAPERPGMGGSDFQPGRTLLDWADDVVKLADGLGLPRFGVELSERLAAILIVMVHPFH